MDLSDKAIVERLVSSCIRGDRKSQQYLYQEFQGKMLAVCMRYATDRDEAKDILHDGFMKVFARLKSFQNLGSLEGWIRRIIVNNAIDHLRKKRDFIIQYDESAIINIKDDYDDTVEVFENTRRKAELILQLVQNLTPAYKAVFNLYVLENYTHSEIAEQLSISVGASKSNLAKAKMKIREMYCKQINRFEE